MRIMFVLWGGLGLLINTINFIGMLGSVRGGIVVGESSFASALALVWIGGMLFFGLGSQLWATTSGDQRPPVTNLNTRPNTPERREETPEGRALAQDQAPASTSRWRWDRDK
jgi:hypothetical protein